MRGSLCFLAGALLIGCDSGPKPPTTYPVKGLVVFSDGAPLTAGYVEFRNTADANFNAIGDIGPDGGFTLRTIFNNKRLDGAVEGTYEVMIQPPIGPDKRGPPSVILPDPIQVKPGESRELTLTYPGAKSP